MSKITVHFGVAKKYRIVQRSAQRRRKLFYITAQTRVFQIYFKHLILQQNSHWLYKIRTQKFLEKLYKKQSMLLACDMFPFLVNIKMF